jgi:Uma2 family endonuclease
MTATHTITAYELWELGSKIEPSELIEGELREMTPPGGEHGRLQARFAMLLSIWAERAAFGQVFGEVGYILKRNPDTVLAPDVSLVSTERLPADISRFLELAPDVAIEVVSPSNAPGEIERKLAIYLETGVRSVWIVYPAEQQIVIHQPHTAPRVVTGDQLLEDSAVLPGFSASLSRVFGTASGGKNA